MHCFLYAAINKTPLSSHYITQSSRGSSFSTRVSKMLNNKNLERKWESSALCDALQHVLGVSSRWLWHQNFTTVKKQHTILVSQTARAACWARICITLLQIQPAPENRKLAAVSVTVLSVRKGVAERVSLDRREIRWGHCVRFASWLFYLFLLKWSCSCKMQCKS